NDTAIANNATLINDAVKVNNVVVANDAAIANNATLINDAAKINNAVVAKNAAMINNAVNDTANYAVTVQQKNKFSVGDELEILSPTATFNKTFIIGEITDTENNKLTTANLPNQIVKINCPYNLETGDILRKRLSHISVK
ncbi:MAG: U32 family peptidase C-terminal domain-containing protein, partial [Christensenellaceae bacterium]|nr:U32 family peptidase C-terminal domain-containing protein [Christensenellaceae bacterium]